MIDAQSLVFVLSPMPVTSQSPIALKNHLDLRVLNKRSDGFPELRTLFHKRYLWPTLSRSNTTRTPLVDITQTLIFPPIFVGADLAC